VMQICIMKWPCGTADEKVSRPTCSSFDFVLVRGGSMRLYGLLFVILIYAL